MFDLELSYTGASKGDLPSAERAHDESVSKSSCSSGYESIAGAGEQIASLGIEACP